MHLTAAILAGGRSTRFCGRNKSALVVDGVPILDRQMAALAEVTSDILIVGGDTAHEHARTVGDLVQDCGPLGGLHSILQGGAHASPSDAVALVACDMPYVSAPLLNYMAALLRTSDGHVDAVVPRTERGLHPLCAIYSRRCLDPVARRLAERQLRMTDLLADLRLRVVPTVELERFGDPHTLLANVNTLSEYDRLDHHAPAPSVRTSRTQKSHEL